MQAKLNVLLCGECNSWMQLDYDNRLCWCNNYACKEADVRYILPTLQLQHAPVEQTIG